MTAPGRIRVLVIDRHESVRRGLSTALAATDDMEVLAVAASTHEVPGLSDEDQPDIVLIDVSDADHGGEGITWVCHRFPGAGIVAMATDLTPKLRAQAELAGARAAVHKFIDFDRLAVVIRDAHAGQTVATPPATSEGAVP